MEKTVEDHLKDLIIARYGDIKSFSTHAEIPNSTLNSILQRGVLFSTIGKIIRLSNALGISVDGLVEGEIRPKQSAPNTPNPLPPSELEHIKKYRRLNEPNRQAIDLTIDGMLVSQDAQKRGATGADNVEISEELMPGDKKKAM